MDTIIHNLRAVSWQVTILIGIIWIISLGGRRLSSEFRYWLWCIVLLRLCIPVGLFFPIGIKIDTDRIVEQYTHSIPILRSNLEKSGDISTSTDLIPPPFEPAKNNSIEEKVANIPRMTGNTIIALIWIFGVLLIASAIIWRVVRLRSRLKKCPAIERQDLLALINSLCKDMGITRRVQLHYMEIEKISGPAVSGGFHPRIYLPRLLADTWPLDELEPVLFHELAHIKRFDAAVNWLQITVQVIYFFHPLVWLANREIRRLREEVCDDMAIQFCGFETVRYSNSIINVIKNIGREPAFGFIGSGFIERKKSLKERIGRIMSDKYRRYSKMTVPLFAILIFIGIISIALAGSKSPSDNIENIIKVAELGDRMVTSGKGTVTFEWGRVDSTGAWIEKKYQINTADTTTKFIKIPVSKVKIFSTGSENLYSNVDSILVEVAQKPPKIVKPPTTLRKSIVTIKPPTTELLIFSTKKEAFISFSGDKYRQEINESFPAPSMYNRHENHIYDGKNYYFSTFREPGIPRYQKKKERAIGIQDPRFYGRTILGTPVASFLKGNVFKIIRYREYDVIGKLKNLQLIGEETIDGIPCMVFRGNYITEYEMRDVIDEGIITVWLAPDMMYRPKCIEKIYEEKSQKKITKRKTVYNTNFRKYDNFWFPDNVLIRNYLLDENSNEWEFRIKRIYTVHDDFEINIDLPDSLFTVSLSQVGK